MISAGLAFVLGLATTPPQTKDLAIKVVVYTTGQIIQADSPDSVFLRRGFILEDDMDLIREAAEIMRERRQAALGDGANVKVDVVADYEPIVTTTDGLNEQLIRDLVELDTLPKVNSDPFEIDQGAPLGPYDELYVIHPLRTNLSSDSVVDGMRIQVNGFFSLDRQSAGSLAAHLFSFLKSPGVKLLSKEQMAGGPAGDFFRITSSSDASITYSPLLDSKNGDQAIDPSKTPMLRIRARLETQHAVGMRLFNEKGLLMGYISFNGSVPHPSELETPSAKSIDLNLPVDGEWQSALVDLRSLTAEPIHQIWLSTNPNGYYFDVKGHGPLSLDISPLVAQANGQATPLATAPARASLAGLSGVLSGADWVTVSTLLASEQREDRLAAASLLTRATHADAVPALLPMLGNASAAEAWLAIEALKHQDTEASWQAIANVVTTSGLDHSRRFACDALRTGKPDLLPPARLGPLLARPSWRLRRAAAQAIAASSADQSPLFLFALPDPDPRVRFAKVAATKLNPYAERKLLWIAVNDPSQRTRAASYSRLLDSEDTVVRSDAMRSVRDESVSVRIQVLTEMAKRGKTHYRPALQRAVIDQDERVRVAALNAFAAQPDKTQAGEIQNTFTDPSTSVQLALIELAKKGKVDLPADVRTRLQASTDAKVKAAAGGLDGGTTSRSNR
jgi:HEAT repeat protein